MEGKDGPFLAGKAFWDEWEAIPRKDWRSGASPWTAVVFIFTSRRQTPRHGRARRAQVPSSAFLLPPLSSPAVAEHARL